MRVIDRLYKYLEQRNLFPYAFERSCAIANGYLKKQVKGKGTIGSDILEKISEKYLDLSITWLVTGTGEMIINKLIKPASEDGNWAEDQVPYVSSQQIITLLEDKIAVLENALADKEKIIKLLEAAIQKK